MFLRDEEGCGRADRDTARRCAVDATFVGRVRGSRMSSTREPAPRTCRDHHGDATQMDAARLGRPQPAPDPRLSRPRCQS